jgi:hypothetical protein
MRCELLYIAEELGIKTSLTVVANDLITQINLMAHSPEGAIRYKGRTIMSFFRSWSAYKNDMNKLAPQYRTSEDVNQFIRDRGTSLFNQKLRRSFDQDLSESEVEAIRRTMINRGDYPMLE